jgi:hypothetical protein
MHMRKTFTSAVVVCAVAGMLVACSREPDVETLPVGTDVQLTRKDGVVVSGKLAERDATQVKVTSGRATRTVARTEVADVKVIEPGKPVELPAIAKYREYSVPGGTTLHLIVQTTVSSDANNEGDPVEARLTSPIMVDDVEVVPEGALVRGVVSDATPAGKVKGVASLGLHFTSLAARDERYQISARWGAHAESEKAKDATKIGIGAGVGAAIGGLIGGGKGAATGAAIGGGAGTAYVLTTAGKPVVVQSGAAIETRLASGVDVRVPIK